MRRSLDNAAWQARRAAKAAAQSGHASANSIPALREVVSRLCEAIGLVPAESAPGKAAGNGGEGQ